MASWFLESVIGSPFGKLAVLALYGVLHGIAYGAIFSSLGRTKVLAWLLAAVHMVAFVGLENDAWKPPRIVGQAAILAPWIAFYALFRRAKAGIEKNYFTESPSAVLALFCGLPAIGPIACAFAAYVFSPMQPSFRLKHGKPNGGKLPVVLGLSRITIFRLIASFLFGAAAVVGFAFLPNVQYRPWMIMLALILAVVPVVRMIPRGNRLVITETGICEYRLFYRLRTFWNDIDHFEVRTRAINTRLWIYKTERVGWVLKSGRSRILWSKYGYWPSDLYDFLDRQRLENRRNAWASASLPKVVQR